MKVSPCRGVEDGKGSGTNSKKSGVKNLEAKSIRSRAESTGGCIKMKTVVETRRNSVLERQKRQSCTKNVCVNLTLSAQVTSQLILRFTNN